MNFIKSIKQYRKQRKLSNESKQNVMEVELYTAFMGRKCYVTMDDGSGENLEIYLVNQDIDFLYYVTFEKNCTKVGALSKQYIKHVKPVTEQKEEVTKLAKYGTIDKAYFKNKTVNIVFQDFHKKKECKEVKIISIHDEGIGFSVRLYLYNHEIVKIEEKF